MKQHSVWRYMDFTKFVDLLANNALFFCRSDKLGDPFEGSVPVKHLNTLEFEHRDGTAGFEKEAKLYAEMGSEFRKYVFVNCWHANEHESAALWSLYVKSGEGIAILSTQDRIHLSVHDDDRPVWFVPVCYIDYRKDHPPVPTRMAPFRYKRKSFEHEREVRLIWYAPTQAHNGKKKPPPAEDGVRIKVDLNTLIRAVYVSPASPGWFQRLTQSVCRSYGLRKQVRQSGLVSELPMFA